jgi:RHS repeat-associated protein
MISYLLSINSSTNINGQVTFSDTALNAGLKQYLYPFGMQMPGREFSQEEYRYGFNGMEKDDEFKGEGNSYDFGARMYDARIGRWLSVDPLGMLFPGESPYMFAGNAPTYFIDPDGNTRVTYLHFQNEDGTETVLFVVDTEDIEMGLAGWPEGDSHLADYDIEEQYYINATDGSFTYTKELHYREESPQRLERWVMGGLDFVSKWEESIKGDGEWQNGGFYLVTEGDATDPTKTKSLSGAEKILADDLLGVLGKSGGKPGIPDMNVKNIVKRLSSVAKEALKHVPDSEYTIPAENPSNMTIPQNKMNDIQIDHVQINDSTTGPLMVPNTSGNRAKKDSTARKLKYYRKDELEN